MCSSPNVAHARTICFVFFFFFLYLQFPPEPFSFLNANVGVKQIDNLISCASTYTNAATHKIVLEEAHQLPEEAKYGVGPRYCPSIYKKCERFPDRTRHLSWLEPEGLNTNVVYPNGMSGPYPEDVQLKIFRTMKVFLFYLFPFFQFSLSTPLSFSFHYKLRRTGFLGTRRSGDRKAWIRCRIRFCSTYES